MNKEEVNSDENNCRGCKNKLNVGEDYYMCDAYSKKLHENCSNSTSSEIKCMNIQNGFFEIMCGFCRICLTKNPKIMSIFEDIHKELKHNRIVMQRMRNDIKNIQMIVNDKNQVTNDNLEELKTKIESIKEIIGDKISDDNNIGESGNKKLFRKVSKEGCIMEPKEKKAHYENKKDLIKALDLAQINVNMKTARTFKHGGVVLKYKKDNESRQGKNIGEVSISTNINPRVGMSKEIGQAPDQLKEKYMNQNWIDKGGN